jgi:hypothetical protein
MRLSTFWLAVTMVVCTACQSEQHLPAIVTNLHTLTIHVDSQDTHRALVSFLTEDLGLLTIYRLPNAYKGRMYAGVLVGDVNLEPCGPYTNIDYARDDFEVTFFGINFTPPDTLTAAAELTRRQIEFTGTSHMNIRELTQQSTGVYVNNLIGFIADNRDSVLTLPAAKREGPLGVLGIAEVQVGYVDDAHLAMWENLLQPAPEIGNNAWQLPDGVIVRFEKSDIKETRGMVLKVKSLDRAVEYLRSKGLLGTVENGVAEIDKDKAFGLRIMLKEG